MARGKNYGKNAELEAESRNRLKWTEAFAALEEHFQAMTVSGYYGEATIRLTAQDGTINHVIDIRERHRR